jgi:hypothetical protein
MSPGECYGAYLALKKHFGNWKYDYFKYRGKLKNVNQQTFDARRDRWVFEKLSKEPDPVGLFVANILADNAQWAGQVNRETYLAMKGRQESLTYLLKQELPTLGEKMSDFMLAPEGTHPLLFKKFMAGKVSPETVSVIIARTHSRAHYQAKYKNDTLMDDLLRKAVKYHPFLSYDVDKIHSLLVDTFSG